MDEDVSIFYGRSFTFWMKNSHAIVLPFLYLPLQSTSSTSESSITTLDDNFISNRTVIDLVSLKNECNNNTIGFLIDSPSPFY